VHRPRDGRTGAAGSGGRDSLVTLTRRPGAPLRPGGWGVARACHKGDRPAGAAPASAPEPSCFPHWGCHPFVTDQLGTWYTTCCVETGVDAPFYEFVCLKRNTRIP
jgi:hypothetical protein